MTTDREIEQMVADCRLTTSANQDQRVLAEAGQILQARTGGSSVPFHFRRIGLRLAVVASLAALILVAFLLRETPHAVAWADVQQKVAEQEWILVRGKANDGETFESWTSIPLKIDALKSGNYIRFVDYKNGFREVYDPVQKTVTRAKLNDSDDWEKDHTMLEMFNVIAKGDDSVEIKSPSPQVEIVSQISRKIERDGKPWIEFELKLQEPNQETPAQLTFLIEPDSRLIRSMQLRDGERQMTAEFSYPKTGPGSILDLDVPKSAETIDKRPNGELLALIDGVRLSAEKFGLYISLNVMQDVDAPWYVGSPFKVWADGNKGRYEFGLIDPMNDAFQKPGPDENQELWWKLRWEQLWHHAHQVSDGDQLRTNSAHPESWTEESKTHPLTSDPKKWPTPKWSNSSVGNLRVFGSPLSFAYSNHLDRAGLENIETELDTDPQTGPENTVLITTKWKLSNPQDFSESRFWIDPNKSHIVMQLEYLSGNASETHRTIITNKELAKSPRGIWYPTLVSHKTITEKDGETTETETLTRHYLDFETQFPEGVFGPDSLQTGSMPFLDGKQKLTAGFPFPQAGARSIRDLELPDTPPTTEMESDSEPSDEVLALIDNVRSSAEKFGPYIAMNVLQGAEAPWYVGTPSVVWSDGNKARVEYGFVDPDRDNFQKPDPSIHQKDWWFERWNQLWHSVQRVSDGKKRFWNNAVPEGWTGLGENFPTLTYPPEDWPAPKWESSVSAFDWPANEPLNLAYDGSVNQLLTLWKWTPEIEPNPDNGPEGTVLLTFTNNHNDPEQATVQRFWIDTRRSYVMMQTERLSGDPLKVNSRRTIKELAKSPSGIWYPTLVSHINYYVRNDGEIGVAEHITRHYLDFETEFPEGVFEPRELPKNQ